MVRRLIGKNIPQFAYALFGVPFPAKGPGGGYAVEGRCVFGLVQIVVQPAAVSAFAVAAIVVGALSPGARVENLVGVGIPDVVVENLVRHPAVYQEKFCVVVVTAEYGGRLGVE